MQKKLKDLNILVKKDLSWVSRMKPAKRYWVVFLFVCLFFIALFFVVYSFKIATRTKTVSFGPSADTQKQEQIKSLPTVLQQNTNSQVEHKIEETRNILLAGIPGPGNSAPNLTDTLMLAHLKTNGDIFLFSLPRDLLVMPPGLNYYTKVNGVFNIYLQNNSKEKAASRLSEKISQITGQKIDNFLIIDLSTLRDIVDFIGGVDVNPQENIYDSCFPGPNNSCQSFYLKAGPHNLSGEMALKYVRTRHSTFGDFDRIKRQQEVVLAIKEKVAQKNLFSSLAFFLETAQVFFDRTITDLSLLDIWKIWQTTKDTDTSKIFKFTISNQPENGLLQSGHFQFGSGQIGYILRPKAGIEDYSEIKKFISDTIK